jgi:hypothetical protein
MRQVIRAFFGIAGIAGISASSFMVSLPLGCLVVGVFCLVVAIGDHKAELRENRDRQRTR